MAKNVNLTIRVEEGLKAEFIDAVGTAESPDVDASKVLREFMRNYIAQARERQTPAANDSLSGMERFRRQEAVAFANASIALEGFAPSEAANVRAGQFMSGEIGVADLGRDRS